MVEFPITEQCQEDWIRGRRVTLLGEEDRVNPATAKASSFLLCFFLTVAVAGCGLGESGGSFSSGGNGGGGTHSVELQWNASTSPGIAGYNVYRADRSGGPYVKLNSSLIAGLTFTDSTVQSGQTYFYVATAIDGSLVESVFSNEVSATIPTP